MVESSGSVGGDECDGDYFQEWVEGRYKCNMEIGLCDGTLCQGVNADRPGFWDRPCLVCGESVCGVSDFGIVTEDRRQA